MSKPFDSLFAAIKEVLEIVTTNELINHIQDLKYTARNLTVTNIIFQNIINLTCKELQVSKNDILHSKMSLDGKRVLAYSIIAYLTKLHMPKFSYNEMQLGLNGNVHLHNLCKYRSEIMSINPATTNKKDIEILASVSSINQKIIKFIKTQHNENELQKER